MGAMLPPMRELYPVPADSVDPFERYGTDDRARSDARPWVLVNMIATVDGATAVEGRSGGLGGPADRLVFRAVRAVADVILVGASTVRTEGYGPPKTPPGRSAPPRLAIVTRSLDMDLTAPVFVDATNDTRPIIVTTSGSDERRRLQLEDVAEVVLAGDADVDVARALAALAERGARVVLCEGGPSLNGQLVAADAIDELCVTVAPLAAGGSSPRLAHGPAPPLARPLRLDRVLEEDDYLFLRYLSVASGPSPSSGA
jgi:riboflavin biosynthesis pyrimidine reductase